MTLLQHVGSVLKKVLHIGEEAAKIAEPFVLAEFPAIGPLYNSALGLATVFEATSTSATGTESQKLSQLVTTLLPLAQKFAADNNLNWPEAEIQKWASAVVDTVNLIPGPVAKALPATVAA